MTGPRGRPPKESAPVVEMATVRCTINNLWTSQGKVLRGEEITIPMEEAAAYDDADKVKFGRPK